MLVCKNFYTNEEELKDELCFFVPGVLCLTIRNKIRTKKCGYCNKDVKLTNCREDLSQANGKPICDECLETEIRC